MYELIKDSKLAIEKVMAEYPDLSSSGFGQPGEKEFEKWREAMVDPEHVRHFELSAEWLRDKGRLRYVSTKNGSSYGLKHRASRDLAKKRDKSAEGHTYISNGMFIAAAVALGFKVKQCSRGNPNAFFNLARIPFEA